MKESLEDFIRVNRSAFDEREPSEKIWKTVRQRLFPHAAGMIYWRAAAILFMALSAFLLYTRWQEEKSDKLVLNEFRDVETFYVREIAEKIDLIEDVSGGDGNLNGFTKDFRQLEAMYAVLNDEMHQRPSRKVKDAMILNLLIRIDLLNKQLEKIERANNADDTRQERESVDSV
ncbi:MAG: hypothetical protein MUE95_12900 [Cyclobacteriaceae bacterium]|jgi:hypothetical protein|nr:hypothetical protein [Cyclobacteriaceae bacterium]